MRRERTSISEDIDLPDRIEILRNSGLLDSVSEESFDRLTRLAGRILGVPVSLVSIVDTDRQFFKSSCGLPEPWATKRETPISYSFCRHVVDSEKPLVIPNTAEDERVCDNPAVTELNVAAYAGIPIHIQGSVVGAFCAIDSKPREWAEADIASLSDLASVVEELIEERSDRKQATISKARLEQILNSTGDAIYGIDEEGNCTFANAKCVEVLGYKSDRELLGRNMHELAHHSYADGRPYPVDDCHIVKGNHRKSGTNVSDEVFWKADGTSFPVEYWSYPIIRGERKMVSDDTVAVVTFIDISDRLERENELIRMRDVARRANRAKSLFLANMSHEIRTPMNAILGFSELLEGLVESPKALRYVQAIHSSGMSLLDLINDVLDLSKIESGKLELSLAPLNLCGVMDSVQMLFSQQAGEQNLEFSVNVSEDCPECVVFDELRVRQILLNLISNAMKFTERGSVCVSVECLRRESEEQSVDLKFSVTDTGRGVPREKIGDLFTPFKQLLGEDAQDGSGLGLSICRKLAKLMGGTISVESVPGEGSTFEVMLPMVEVAASSAKIVEKSAASVDFNSLSPSSILVVDDNAFNRDLAKGYLDDSHHVIEFAEDGLKAIKKVEESPPDIVLMDIRMPVLDGKEAFDRIKQNPDFQSIPIVAVTASSMLRDTEDLKRKFDGFVRKPYSRSQLFDILQEFLPSYEETAAEALTRIDVVSPEAAGMDESAKETLKEKFSQWEAKRVPEMLGTMAMGQIVDFACELYEIAEDFGSETLAEYARQMRESAESFEMAEVELYLRAFPKIKTQITAQIAKLQTNEE